MAALWNDRVKLCAEVLLGTRPKEDAPGGSRLMSVDEYAETVRDSAVMDRIRWPRLAAAGKTTVAWTGNTFDDNISFLKNFLQKRIEFLDEAWGGIAVE